MSDEIDNILNDVLADLGHDLVDGILIESDLAFEKFMVAVAERAFPDHEISVPKPGMMLVNAKSSTTININDIFESLKKYSPGHNRDIVKHVFEMKTAQLKSISDMSKQSLSNMFDLEKLVLLPKMGSFARHVTQGPQIMGERPEETAFLHKRAFNYIYSVPAINTPDYVFFVPKLALEDIGLSEDEVFERAQQNLKRDSKNVNVEFEDDLAFIDSGEMNGMASQLIFDPDFWKALSQKARDDLFIHVAKNDEIIICKAHRRDIILRLMADVATGELGSLLPATFFTHDAQGFRIFAKVLPDDA